jgi:chitin disaccharide deacetylase
VYLDLAVEFRLPVRLPGADEERLLGFPLRHLAAEEGVVFPDHFAAARAFGSRERVEKVLQALQPGVTEIHVQPASDTPELRAMSPEHWSSWVDDLDLVLAPDGLAALLAQAGAIPIGFRELRALVEAEPTG